MTSGMVAVTGRALAGRCVPALAGPVEVLAGPSGTEDAPQAVTEARSRVARAGLKYAVTVMFSPA
ncbi:hypothetical protein GCM10010236_29960 [Streptomyces eurythermus]|nr:hypothetical protein GCM10010236_29960 [Streptomyces eurythermus]